MATLTIAGNASAAPPAYGACSAYVVEHLSTKVLLDCGPGSLANIRAATSVHELDAVFISHMHTDHFLDLLALNVALWTEEGHRTVGGARWRLPVYLPPGAFATLDAVFKALTVNVTGTNAARYSEALDCREYDPEETIRAGEIVVSFVGPTKHSTTDYGMRVRAGNGLLGYTGDTARCDAAVEVGRDAGLFLAECTLLDVGRASDTHTSAGELGEMASLAGSERLLATHFIDHSGAFRAGATERLAAATRVPFELVTLGQVFEF